MYRGLGYIKVSKVWNLQCVIFFAHYFNLFLQMIALYYFRCRNLSEYMKIAEKVKEFFHNEGIHSTTIQPEFVEVNEVSVLYRDTQFHTYAIRHLLTSIITDSSSSDWNYRLTSLYYKTNWSPMFLCCIIIELCSHVNQCAD